MFTIQAKDEGEEKKNGRRKRGGGRGGAILLRLMVQTPQGQEAMGAMKREGLQAPVNFGGFSPLLCFR